MPHPTFGPAEHVLEVVRLSLTLPSSRNGRRASLSAHGEASTKRGSLWSYNETWTPEESVGAMSPADVAHWLLLSASQDRPASSAQLERCLTPGGWEDVLLPF